MNVEIRILEEMENGHYFSDRGDTPVSENCTSEIFEIPGDPRSLVACGKKATTLITYPANTGYMILCEECKHLFLDQHNSAPRRETIQIEDYSLSRNKELAQRALRLKAKVAEVTGK